MELFAYHNSADLRCRNPLGALRAGSTVTLALKADSSIMAATLIVYYPNNLYNEFMCYRNDSYWEVDLTVPETTGLLWYQFMVRAVDGRVYWYGPDYGKRSGIGCLKEHSANGYQITVYDKDFDTPRWTKGGIMYQIFPDRYAIGDPENRQKGYDYHTKMGRSVYLHDSFEEDVVYTPMPGQRHYYPSDFYGGDLKGIMQNLDQLKKLGVSVLYLNPICEADSNHRYNTSDYKKVDPFLGTNEDFKALCKAAGKLGIRVVVDGVFSHTGDDSIYFNKRGSYGSGGAYMDENSPYRSWFKFGSGGRDDYQSWWGFETLPEVEEHNPDWQQYIFKGKDSVFAFWLGLGCGGYRLDVADEIPDDVLKLMRTALKQRDKNAFLLGEVWEDATTKESVEGLRTYALGDALDSVMNYPFRKAVADFLNGNIAAGALCDFFDEQKLCYPQPMYHSLMNLLSTHDVARLVTYLGSKTEGKQMSRDGQKAFDFTPIMRMEGRKKAALAAALQMSVPGMPCIYYGDEYAMEGFSDPFNRAPLDTSCTAIYDTVQKYAKLRSETDCLQLGHSTFIAGGEDCVGVLRFVYNKKNVLGERAKNGMVLTIVNRSSNMRRFSCDFDRVTNTLSAGALSFLHHGSYTPKNLGVGDTFVGKRLQVLMDPMSSVQIVFDVK